MRLLRLRRGGGAAGTDGPHRFIGEDEMVGVEDAERGSLSFQDREGLARIAFRQGLTDAVDDLEARGLCGLCPRQRRFVGLGKERAPLRVADNGPTNPDFGEHGGGHFGGEGDLLVKVTDVDAVRQDDLGRTLCNLAEVTLVGVWQAGEEAAS